MAALTTGIDRKVYTTPAHPVESAFLVLLIVRRMPPVLLVKMGLISDRSACLKSKGFCVCTNFYGGAIKQSSN